MNKKINIMWELTLNCNLTCSFCLTWERRKITKWKISYKEALNIIDNFPKNSHISFIWWENFLFPNFIDVLKYLEKKWMTFEITTNWSIVEKFIDELNSLKNLTNIYFSIDLYWENHDKIRWQIWLFNKIIKTIPKLNKKIYINTVILENTDFEELLKIYKLTLKLNISHWRLAYYTNFSKKEIENSIKKVPEIEIQTKFEEWINNLKLRRKTLLFYKKILIINKELKTNMTIDLNPVSIIRWYPKTCKNLENNYFRINEYWNLNLCHFINNSLWTLIENKLENLIQSWNYIDLKNKVKKEFPLDICKNCWKWV